MGVRKNAKFLTAAEREAFVKACVLMKPRSSIRRHHLRAGTAAGMSMSRFIG
jgi:hypothetical protein